MHVRHPAPARQQRPQIATRLRAVQVAEGPAHFRDVHIVCEIGRDDEKQTAVGPAFMQLAGGMEIARPDAERRRAAQRLGPGGTQRLELRNHRRRWRDVRENGEVVSRAVRPPQLREREGG